MPYKDAEKQKEAQKRYEEKRKAQGRERHKVWTLICYPDSMPDDWEEQLSEAHLRVWLSPLHDRDEWTRKDEAKNPAHKAGTLKKAHYHLIADYDVQVDRDTFLADFRFLNGPESVKAVKSLVAMVRYLIHKDDPQKAQYSREDVRVFCGADVGLLDAVGDSEYMDALAAMYDFIDEAGIMSYAQFVRYCRHERMDWFRLVNTRCAYTVEKYIKSNRYDMQDAIREADRKHFGQ